MDPVIQISNVVQLQGAKEPIVKNVFTLRGCLPIVGAQIIPSDTEAGLLLKWRDFVVASDPDILTGCARSCDAICHSVDVVECPLRLAATQQCRARYELQSSQPGEGMLLGAFTGPKPSKKTHCLLQSTHHPTLPPHAPNSPLPRKGTTSRTSTCRTS